MSISRYNLTNLIPSCASSRRPKALVQLPPPPLGSAGGWGRCPPPGSPLYRWTQHEGQAGGRQPQAQGRLHTASLLGHHHSTYRSATLPLSAGAVCWELAWLGHGNQALLGSKCWSTWLLEPRFTGVLKGWEAPLPSNDKGSHRATSPARLGNGLAASLMRWAGVTCGCRGLCHLSCHQPSWPQGLGKGQQGILLWKEGSHKTEVGKVKYFLSTQMLLGPCRASARAQACRRQPVLFKAELVMVCFSAFRLGKLMPVAAGAGNTKGLHTFAQEIHSVKLWY